ncbi:hypothetical protein V6N13_046624 [Hibiscus sabdariffa]
MVAAPTEPDEIVVDVYIEEIRMVGSCCMFKVHDRLFDVNLYQSVSISIGPYHYGNPVLDAMERTKRSVFWAISDQVGAGLYDRHQDVTDRTLGVISNAPKGPHTPTRRLSTPPAPMGHPRRPCMPPTPMGQSEMKSAHCWACTM